MMLKNIRQVVLNLIVIFLAEALVREGVRVVREQFTGRRKRRMVRVVPGESI